MKYIIWYETNNGEIYEEIRSKSKNVPVEIELWAMINCAKQVGSIQFRGGLKDFGVRDFNTQLKVQ